MKCEAITCRNCKLEKTTYTYGYCQKKCPKIKDNYTCADYAKREENK